MASWRKMIFSKTISLYWWWNTCDSKTRGVSSCLLREKQYVILLLWIEQALLLSACGHFTAQSKHWNGRGDWVFSWHAALHPDATDWPVLEGPQLICLHGRRSVILPGCPRKSDSSEYTFLAACDHMWTEDCFSAANACLLFCPLTQLDYSSTPLILNSSQRFNMPLEFDIWLNLDGNLMTCGLWPPVETLVNSLWAY